MPEQGIIDFGTAIIGVDPSTRVVGICFMLGGGEVMGTWSVRAKGDPLNRLYTIQVGVKKVFDEIRGMAKTRPEVIVEEGMFGGGKEPRAWAPKVAALAGEVRGVVLSEAWRHGWRTRKMSIQTWKTQVDKGLRKMKKDQAYVSFWNGVTGLHAKYPDEIDAYFIARRAAVGK